MNKMIQTQSTRSKKSKSSQALNHAEDQIRKLIEITTQQMQKYPGQAQKNMEHAKALIEEFELNGYLPRVMLLDGSAQWQSGSYHESITILKECIQLTKKRKLRKIESMAELNLGISYFQIENYQAAVKHYYRCLKVQNDYGPFEDIASLFSNIAGIYSIIGKYGKAIEYYKYSFKLAKKEDDQMAIAFSLNNIGTVFLDKGDFDKAVSYFQRSISYSANLGYKALEVLSNLNIGFIKLQEGKYDESEVMLTAAISYYKKADYPHYLIYAKYGMAELKFLQNDLDGALSYLDKVLEFAASLKVGEYLMKSYLLYSKIFERKADFLKSNKYQKKHLRIAKLASKKKAKLKIDDQKLKSYIAILDIKNQHEHSKTLELKKINHELKKLQNVVIKEIQEPLKALSEGISLRESAELDSIRTNTIVTLKEVKNGADSLEKLLEGISEYTTLSSSENYFESVDLTKVLRTVRHNLSEVLDVGKAVIKGENLPFVHANFALMVRLFQAIIENSIIYNDSTIPSIKISSRLSENKYIISIEDNGIGIDRQVHKSVYSLLNLSNHAQEFETSAIGLSICKKIIEKHHGKIWLESTEGSGTTICFQLIGS